MNIKGLDKARILKALYNASTFISPVARALGNTTHEDMTLEEATETIRQREEAGQPLYFDYVGGRVVKFDLGDEVADFRLYDRDMGAGAGERAIREEFRDELTGCV